MALAFTLVIAALEVIFSVAIVGLTNFGEKKRQTL
jgi:hypothetical protein